MSDTTRIVLGEGYGVGKGMIEDGFKWVGLSCHPGSAMPVTLRHNDFDRIVNGVVKNPGRRRRFRLVLEVIEEAGTHPDVLAADDAQLAGGA